MKRNGIRLVFAFLLIWVCSCDFYGLRENKLIGKFEDAGLHSRFHTVGSTTLHYWIGGKGPAILLVHGFGADSLFQWYDQIPALIENHTLIVPDLIYFGKSTSRSNDYSVEFQADVLIDLLKSLDVENVSIIGISYGGLVSAFIADKIPARVPKLILCDSPVKFYSRADNERALEKFDAKTIQELLIPEEPEGVLRLLELAYHEPEWVPSFTLANIRDNISGNQPTEKGRLLQYMLDNERVLTAKEYHVYSEILLIWGEYDSLIPVSTGERLRDYFKGRARLEVIDETAHMPNLEKPEEFNRLIVEFLSSD